MRHVTPIPLTTATGLLITALLYCTSASADIYRCATSEGPPRFSQFPCGNSEPVQVDTVDTVRIPPISDTEQRLLDELEQRRQARREQQARARRQAAREARAEQAERRERCEAARAARTELDRRRRKGYSLSEARALDRRDAELEAQERENC